MRRSKSLECPNIKKEAVTFSTKNDNNYSRVKKPTRNLNIPMIRIEIRRVLLKRLLGDKFDGAFLTFSILY
ncbi:hypothetical protein ACHWQZ_G008050 [Mnemiopsis leidyi]